MDLLRRLQEVAELPGGSSVTESLDAEELSEQLAASRTELQSITSKYDALRGECSNLQEEYTAYKVKVQTWREQMKAARAQDRKTIELLRDSSAGNGALSSSSSAPQPDGGDSIGTPDGRSISRSGGGVGELVEVAYVRSLEEQVKCLKESLREYGNQRDAMALEVDRLKETSRRQVLAAGGQELHIQGGGVEGHLDSSLDATKLAVLLERTTEDLRKSQRQVADLEQQNEQLQVESQKTNELLLEAMTKRREEARALEAHSSADAQQMYILSLEQELTKWRAAATAADDLRLWKSEVAAIGKQSPAARKPIDGEPDASRAGMIVAEDKLREANEKLQEQQELIENLSEQLSSLEASAAVRDESVDHMYAENRQLRLRLETAISDAESAERSLGEAQSGLEDRAREVRRMQLELDERDLQLTTAKNANQQLTRELHSARDALRVAKADAAKVLAVTPTAATAVRVQSGEEPNVAASGDEGASVIKLSHSRISSLQAQMKTAWDAVANRQRAIWSNQKLRLYYVTGLLVCLVLLFTFYQTTALIDDPVCEEALSLCLRKIKDVPSS